MISATDREGRCIFANAAAASSAAKAGERGAVPPGGGRGRWRDVAIFEGGRPVSPYSEDAPGGAGRRLLTSKVPLRDGAGEVVAVLTASFELPEDTPADAPADAREGAGPAPPPGAE